MAWRKRVRRCWKRARTWLSVGERSFLLSGLISTLSGCCLGSPKLSTSSAFFTSLRPQASYFRSSSSTAGGYSPSASADSHCAVSIRLAMSISSLRLRSLISPIARRYRRTGSEVDWSSPPKALSAASALPSSGSAPSSSSWSSSVSRISMPMSDRLSTMSGIAAASHSPASARRTSARLSCPCSRPRASRASRPCSGSGAGAFLDMGRESLILPRRGAPGKAAGGLAGR